MIGFLTVPQALDLMSHDAEDGCDVADALQAKRAHPGYPRFLDEVRRDGISVPVLVDTTGRYWALLDGHHRIAAAIDAGLDAVPYTTVPLCLGDADRCH